MTPQELKNSILQLAIQGRLVEQRPEEGTAEELFKQIQAEKQRLIKEGKIKKDKPLPEITEEEKPFEIPEGWMWVRFGFISQLLDGEKRSSVCYPCLDARYLRGKTEATILDCGKFISKGTRTILVDGENSGEVFQVGEDGYLGSTFKVLYFSDSLCAQYVLNFLLLHKSDYRNNKKGSAIPHLNKELFFSMPFPIPPIAEQKRIVAKIEELLPYIDRYEQAWSKLENFNKCFPVDMQKSILQTAIQGKLVEQHPEEGTGEELYKQIQTEKQRLIKDGKIKKEKTLPEITEEEKPFDIPESWKWVRIGDVFETSSGTTPLSSDPDYYANGNINWVRTTDLNNSALSTCEIRITEKALEECNLRIIPMDSVCVAMYGGAGTIGKNARIVFNTTINQSVCAIHPNGFCDMRYVQMYLQYQRPNWMDYASGSRKDPNINKIIIKNSLIPIPPLAEQKRIVAKLEELLPLCERLK